MSNKDIFLNLFELKTFHLERCSERFPTKCEKFLSGSKNAWMGEATIESQDKLSPKCGKRQLSPATIESQKYHFKELTKRRQLSPKRAKRQLSPKLFNEPNNIQGIILVVEKDVNRAFN